MNEIAIYGAGSFGKIFYELIDEKIDFFIDDYSLENLIFGIPIKNIEVVPKNTTIYISVLQNSFIIEQKLIEKGFNHVINFSSSVKKIPNILKRLAKNNYLWLVDDNYKMYNKEELSKVKKLLSDEKSKIILEQMTKLRETLDIKYYIEPSDKEYFPKDIPIFENIAEMNFIDCGAYVGDTVKDLMSYCSKVNYCISFEPDTKNLKHLSAQLAILNQNYPNTNFFIYPAGVYSSNKILSFSNQGINSSASFIDNSDIKIPVVALDEIVLNSNPNYIKMDIEGSEKEAILGAQKTIKKYKPNLAICLYHKPEDLWELPLLINKIEPNYKMYLRVHEDLCLSTVLYCIYKK